MRTVLAHGVFDGLHAGHIHLLENARKLGDELVVSLLSDRFVTLYKGPSRPIHTLAERRAAIEALPFVARTVVVDGPGHEAVEAMIRAVNPAVYVKGEETRGKFGEAKMLADMGVIICYLDMLMSSGKTISTTRISEKRSNPAFIINNRNKGKYVYRCVTGALAQTVPCDIHIEDFGSTDNSREEIKRALEEAPRGAVHEVNYYEDNNPTTNSMRAVNLAIQKMVSRIDNEWVFQCSSDDYSLPDRVKTCLRAVAEHDCVGVATTFHLEDPEKGIIGHSGYPTESGYVSPGLGLHKMAYGSTIWGYRREFLQKVGLDVPCTLDVYLGFLAACDRGYYVIADPQHVHFMAHDLENIGFQGKMRAAEISGDTATIHRLNELNRFQLFELYLHTKYRQQQLYPMAHQADQDALVAMLIAQAQGWYAERKRLHDSKLTPMTL